jgi:superfamily II DNA or RNA helicase
MSGQSSNPCLSDWVWQAWYRSTECDILHDFYIPALRTSVRYDRVAGYFTSTSLAVASQGFTALIKHQGHVRLVVGADLDPEDVRAIVDQDDRERLADSLLAELGSLEAWPDAVSNGLGLLCWMVQEGYLELRVALRVHRETGEPLTFTSRVDGYAHEKWAVFRDAEGHRLVAAGSLNESKTALTLNAENVVVRCDWEGDKDAQFADQVDASFETIWNDEDPGLRVLTLPDAVRERLIQVAASVAKPKEVDGSSELPPEVPLPSAKEWLQFAILRDAPRMPNGRLVGMVTAPVEPWPHQAVVARRLIESWPYSFLLCDEVGLGKTIEAGLALRSLILSGLARRVLIAPPASLAKQWHNELKDKFYLPFARALNGAQPRHEVIHPTERQFPSKSVFAPDLAIVSTGLVRRKERRKELTSHDWDIALVDEAHYAGRKNATNGTTVQPRYGELYRAVAEGLRPNTKALWLATATPMQLDPIEVYDLFQLTRRVGPFLQDPSLTAAYYEVQGRIQRGEQVYPDELEFVRQVLRSIRRHDPELAEHIRETVLTPANRMQYDNWLEKGFAPTAFSLKQLLRAIFASAPLSRVMMRHNRALLRVYQQRGELKDNLAHRHVLPMRRIQYTAQEKQAYDALEDYAQDLSQQVTAANDQQARVSTGFYLSFLRRRFASSLWAIAETLRRRRERVAATLEYLVSGGSPAALATGSTVEGEEDFELDDSDAEIIDQLLKNRSEDDLRWELERLTEMLGSSLYDAAPASSKMQALLGYVQQRKDPDRPGRIGQMVIFSQFWDTVEDIVRRFKQVNQKFLIGTYSGRGGQYTDPETGKLVGIEREEIKKRFLRGQVDILVCTDAAAEGLNLQTADYLVNFDLPWNPAKVEQRIGRIDRIGQRHNHIYVQNLCYLGSVEEIVYDRLLNRLGEMISVVGEQQLSMLPVTEEDFRRLADGEITEQALEKEALERVAVTQRRIRETELTGQEIYEIYQRMALRNAEQRLPATLDDIWDVLTTSKYLVAIGCHRAANLTGDAHEPLLLNAIPGVPDGTALTVKRELFDEGIEALGTRLHFATYGDTCFDALLELSATWATPPCVRRITVTPKNLHNEHVGYVVAVKNDPVSPLRLITAITQLAALHLDQSATVTEEDAAGFVGQLQDLVDRELKLSAHVDAIEADNILSGRAQAALVLGVAFGAITSRQRFGNGDPNFWKEIDAWRAQIESRTDAGGALHVHNIPDLFGKVASTALLAFNVKRKISEDSYWIERAPRALLTSAADAASRVAEGIKRKKYDVSTELGLSRLEAEMKRVLSI